MLRLNQISLVDFKNYETRSFRFTERIIGISGRNGIGKTNLLDAIHYLCFTKSYFTRLDADNVHHGGEGFRLEGDFTTWDKTEKVVCIFRQGGKKEFSVNDNSYPRFSQHVGRYPCVMVAPDDIQIITGGSEERRRFIDMLLAQLDAEYLQQLIRYNKVLQQRNSLLRSLAGMSNKDVSLLQVFDEQLINHGEKIFEKRKQFLVSFLPLAKKLYTEIAADQVTGVADENVLLFYNSELLQSSFPELLRACRPKDMLLLRTTAGIHRDDLEFTLNGQPLKNIASQGQRKSLLFALKLAEMNVLKKKNAFAPVLLLDDVFEKLDEQRIGKLLLKVCVENDGQVFITDTSEDRLVVHLDMTRLPYQLVPL